VASIPKNHDTIKGQSRFRAIPLDKFIDGMPISALSFGTAKTIENGCSGVLEIGKAQYIFRLSETGSGAMFLLHGLWPPHHEP
jgi:hypothetical protein